MARSKRPGAPSSAPRSAEPGLSRPPSGAVDWVAVATDAPRATLITAVAWHETRAEAMRRLGVVDPGHVDVRRA